jgi:hypothetical protein
MGRLVYTGWPIFVGSHWINRNYLAAAQIPIGNVCL